MNRKKAKTVLVLTAAVTVLIAGLILYPIIFRSDIDKFIRQLDVYTVEKPVLIDGKEMFLVPTAVLWRDLEYDEATLTLREVGNRAGGRIVDVAHLDQSSVDELHNRVNNTTVFRLEKDGLRFISKSVAVTKHTRLGDGFILISLRKGYLHAGDRLIIRLFETEKVMVERFGKTATRKFHSRIPSE
ncbi:MAG: hypothetical protein ABIA75_03175 [Candidatus Neomarinimicrobiota bacterium]